jgi:hypothetical protein
VSSTGQALAGGRPGGPHQGAIKGQGFANPLSSPAWKPKSPIKAKASIASGIPSTRFCRIARISREFSEVLMDHGGERELLAREDNEINDHHGINPIRLLTDEIEKITFTVGG